MEILRAVVYGGLTILVIFAGIGIPIGIGMALEELKHPARRSDNVVILWVEGLIGIATFCLIAWFLGSVLLSLF